MAQLRKFMENHRRIAAMVIFACFIFIGCCSFPVYNFTHKWPVTLTFLIFGTTMMANICLGNVEARLCPDHAVFSMLLLNIFLVTAGMGCRYLLEFGEVSNIYNFTIPNITFHSFMAVTVSTLAWLKGKRSDL